MKAKLYSCEIPECDRQVAIRSTVKSGEHKGKKVCQVCKQRLDGGGLSTATKLKPITKKTMDRRKEERDGLPEFFADAVEIAKIDPYCDNCGRRLNLEYNPHWNIAHILPKQKYKSVMTHPLNWIKLCTSKEDGDCHHKFDNNISGISDMVCFDMAKSMFEIFKPEVLERGIIFTIFEEN